MLGARADKVIVNGEILVDNGYALRASTPNARTPPAALLVLPPQVAGVCGLQTNVSMYAIKDVTIYTMRNVNAVLTGTVLVENGVVTCLGGSCVIPLKAQIWTLNGGAIVPGFIDFGDHVGQIGMEVTVSTIVTARVFDLY